MATVTIIGDGPAGLSAALFLAKNGQAVTVYGQDKTAMHWAYLYNYLGIPEIAGTEFMQIARAQVAAFGAAQVSERVHKVESGDDGFVITLESGEQMSADYVIFAEGKGARIAAETGVEKTDAGLVVDRHGRTSIANAYAVGRGTRIHRSQAMISAGEGAAAALDILSIEHGKDFNDFDTPPETSN